MKILIACEESQTVCKAFREAGHEAYSCDLVPCSGGHPEWHIQADCLDVIRSEKWDMIIAHPPCTYLSVAGNRWLNVGRYGAAAEKRIELRQEALAFFLAIAEADCPKIAIENPTGYANTHYRKPDQILHPYMFGDPVHKRTCLWLKGLSPLCPTNVVQPETYGVFKKGKHKGKPINWCESLPRSASRASVRSKTFEGIAQAMAQQWGNSN